MTPSEVIRLAHEAGLVLMCDMADGYIRDGKYTDQLARLISLAKAEEREACALVCEGIEDDYQRAEGHKYPELKNDAETGASRCAYAIRARTKEAP